MYEATALLLSWRVIHVTTMSNVFVNCERGKAHGTLAA
jgi:hypothetical protein